MISYAPREQGQTGEGATRHSRGMATFALQVSPENATEWLDTARRAEAAGFTALYVADHPGKGPAPFVALAAAAAVTSTIKLGSYVVNAGVREPMLLAADVATLDVISGGRAVLGLGAGHTPAEWAAVGKVRPEVAGRVDRFIAVAEATARLLAGAEVTVDVPELTMLRARLDGPAIVQERVPLLFGGGNSRLLRWAAEHADVIGLAGTGRTLADGYQHNVRWRTADVDAQIELTGSVPVEALVQRVEVTDDADRFYADLAKEFGEPEDVLRDAPYILAGTADEIVAEVAGYERRWGITRYAVRRNALDLLGPLLPRLNG
jgi:probable F420-dependent oxidoreductase